MSGGGSAPSAPSNTTSNSTDTVIQGVPDYEQQYLSDLLGQASTEAAQPYQQFPGQQVAGFTDDQNQAFSNVENLANNGAWQGADTSALNSATAGANTANNIYSSAAPDINASTTYNPLAAASPYLNASAGAATPQGISSYLSPYTNDVVSGLVNTANQNWNNNIMPSVNDAFIGSGQFASGRNAQVLGQQANTFEQNLEGSVSNALESGYTTAGNQAATEAGILGNAANTASSATAAQAANLQNAGNSLGNIAATQAGAQGNAATNLASTGQTALNTGVTAASALQDVGQQQQNLNQQNINTAVSNFQNQVAYPEQQAGFLSDIIRGLPTAGSSTTGAAQSPTTTSQIGSTSPLSALGGTILGASGLGAKQGGLIKGYANGGQVDGDEEATGNPADVLTKLLGPDIAIDDSDLQAMSPSQPTTSNPPPTVADTEAPISAALQDAPIDDGENAPKSSPLQAVSPQQEPTPGTSDKIRNYQLLAMARGMLTPAHSGAEALGNAIGGYEDVGLHAPIYEGQQQETIGKQLNNAVTYAGLQRQNSINQSMGASPIPLPNIPGLSTQQPQSPSNIQSATVTPGGQFKPIGTQTNAQAASGQQNVQSTSAQGQSPQSSQPMNVMQALQIANGRVPATEQQKYDAVNTLQAVNYPIPAVMAEEAKKYAQDTAELSNASDIEAAKAQGKAIYTPTETRGEGGVTLFRDPITGQQKMLTGRFKGESMQGAGTLTPASLQPLQAGAGLPGQGGSQLAAPQGQQPAGVSAPPQMDTKWPVPVPIPDAPFGVKQGENLTSLPEYVNQWRDKNYPMMSNLQTQMQQQSAIDDSLDKLKGASMLQPGTWGEQRLAIVNAINTAQSAMGVTNPNALMSQQAAASAAEFIKSAQQNTNAAAHEISSKGTNFDIVSAAKANPQYSMPYMAGVITNAMNSEAVTRNYNRIKYIDDRLNNGVSESQATQEFEQQQPGNLVVKRAESLIAPVPVTKATIGKFLPGTQVKSPDGRTGYVPIPKDYPFMVPYVNPLMKAQQTGSQ